jgi:fermentation-respiration switch protein FrsA (DUF1100 family)
VLVDLDPPSAGVLVAFGGIWGGLGAFPIFEFRRTLSSVGCKCVYLLDHHQAWYHRGVTGIGSDLDTVADWLRRLSAEHGRIVTIGNSAGGYAALLFAALTGCEAHAFSPQTFIDAELRRECGDGRWQEELDALEKSGRLDRRYADLLPVLAAGRGRFHVYYGRDDALDVHHAERLRGVEGMTIHAHDGSGHNVVRELRDSGRLRELAEGLAR